LNEDIFGIVIEYLTDKEKFNLCISGSRIVPHMWGVVLISYSKSLKRIQERCEAQGILTEIASDAQIEAQEQWWQSTQMRQMMLEDGQRYAENHARFETDLDDILEVEQDKLNRFQATVGVLADVMQMWSRCCARRDKIAQMCQSFHSCVGVVFGLHDNTASSNTASSPATTQANNTPVVATTPVQATTPQATTPQPVASPEETPRESPAETPAETATEPKESESKEGKEGETTSKGEEKGKEEETQGEKVDSEEQPSGSGLTRE